jgi:hypothetical protein
MVKSPSKSLLKVEDVKISDLSSDPANLRLHSDRNLQAIKNSLARFGQQKPIVIDSKNIVRAGNGTLDAAKLLGWETISCARSDLKGSDLIAFGIADNRSAELATWDEGALTDMLIGLGNESDELLLAAGYDVAEVDALIDASSDPAPPEEFKSFDENIETDYECPQCNYKWSGLKSSNPDK